MAAGGRKQRATEKRRRTENEPAGRQAAGLPPCFMDWLREQSWQAEDVYWQTRGRALTEDMFTKWHQDEWAPAGQTGYMCRFDKEEWRRLQKFDSITAEEREPNTQASVSEIR